MALAVGAQLRSKHISAESSVHRGITRARAQQNRLC
jgi:hypothetical protein